MTHATLTDFRSNIARYFDQIETDRTELVVTRQNHEPCVVMPLAELEGLRETLHVLSTRANAERIHRSLAELNAGRGIERELIEP